MEDDGGVAHLTAAFGRRHWSVAPAPIRFNAGRDYSDFNMRWLEDSKVGAVLRSYAASESIFIRQGASLPAAKELPEDLSPLLRRNALALSDARRERDVEDLIKSLEGLLKG